MKFLRDLIARKRKPDTAIEALSAEVPDLQDVMAERPKGKAAVAEQKKAAAVNIWDMDDDVPGPEDIAAAAAVEAAAGAAPVRATSRQRRTKTRLIGFDSSDGASTDIFSDAPKTAPTVRAKFPVGWILVTEGPGLGECFSLTAGMSQIGRGEDQAVQLDFGDAAISRTNHAAIVFDPETKTFTLGHGGKSNIVRLNDAPVISNEPMKNGDVIRLGEGTVLRFVALCGEDFAWNTADQEEENDDVAIA